MQKDIFIALFKVDRFKYYLKEKNEKLSNSIDFIDRDHLWMWLILVTLALLRDMYSIAITYAVASSLLLGVFVYLTFKMARK